MLPLDKELWIKEMSKDLDYRLNCYNIIADAGYDIVSSVDWLSNLYKELINE